MRDANVDELIGYIEAAAILGLDRLNALIANELLQPIRLNDRPGAPSMFSRSAIERRAR